MHAKTYRRALALFLPALGMLAGATVAAAPAQAAPSCSVTYRLVGAWPRPGESGPAGFHSEFIVTNNGTVTTKGWRIEVHFAAGVDVESNWSSEIVLDAEPTYVFGNSLFNGPIRPGGTTAFGVIASKTSAAVSNTPLNSTCAPLV